MNSDIFRRRRRFDDAHHVRFMATWRSLSRSVVRPRDAERSAVDDVVARREETTRIKFVHRH